MAGGEKEEFWVFQGFSSPNYTTVPDEFFDTVMPRLSEAELKVLLYIMRRTFGFKKDADNISLRQLCTGITTADGRQLDHGTGLSKSGVTKALVLLRRRGLVVRTLNADSVRGSTPTTYHLRLLGTPLDVSEDPPEIQANDLSTDADTPVHERRHPLFTGVDTPVHSTGQPLSTPVDTQETVNQETVNGETDRIVDISTGRSRNRIYSEAREELQQFVIDFAREFSDEAPVSSSLTRMVNLYLRSGLTMDDFVGLIYDARARTKEHQANVTKAASGGRLGAKNRMPYFFAVVQELVDQEQSGT